ncbi:uncharacterized protein LOC106142186 isoform X2 [Amyelois transitella]|uniref:uncharacterized protein LOC106142186 isoform X2 n=1 Tax=Amyelois transitella TaxID=680683 RepID=UPI0029900FE4|nr:uncharacterized protein LOC106142186 isoform X2 [Amyelois transitella]
MLLKRNLLEFVTIISCSGTVICLLLHYFTNLSPISGGYLISYLIATFVGSLFFSFKFIQYLLHLNKPLKYDLERFEGYSQIFGRVLPRPPKLPKNEVSKEYDTNELSVISTVLEKKLVSSWYLPYVSQEIGFPFACKQMLDQMIGKTFQICNKIETKDVYVDMCSIMVMHLKEYKKALKRHEKSPKDNIENLYKKSHSLFNGDHNTVDATDHCTNIIRLILKELISWELWDTPHSELLVRILSKKLDNFINNTLANPQWLNDRLMTILKGKEVIIPKEKVSNFDVKEEIKQEILVEETKMEPTVQSAQSNLITNSSAPVLLRDVKEEYAEQIKMQDIVEEVPVTSSEPVDIKSSPILRQRRGRQGRNEVKIYDRIIEGSVKTWETDLDLQCISLGQDLLASLDGEITLSRLWGQDAEPEGSPNPPRNKSPQPLWFGEEDAIDVEMDTTTSPQKTSPVRKEHSPKPADALLKDLQTTVHQAKTKIGDLQDEAAGMMEGLLDFGIAGLKKGLRFTGLSDDSQEKSPSHHKSDKVSPATDAKTRMERDIGISSVIQKEDNGTPAAAPPLIKQQRVISQDSLPSQAKPVLKGDIPPLSSLVPLSDSPEPEYEEAADLSASIAKLRCLLQQRETAPRPEIWWGEESRGRSHDRHIDTATLADEYDQLSLDRNSPGQTAKSDGMQRLDRLFQRTVTGVFNSIKTAVGGEGADGGEAPRHQHDWTYVCTSAEASASGALCRLLARRAHAHVDAALDSLRLAATDCNDSQDVIPDDFEEWLWTSGKSWSAVSELVTAGGLLRSHVAVRLATVICADLGELIINSWLEQVGPWLRAQVFLSFRDMERDSTEQEPLRELRLEDTVAAVVNAVPAILIFGEETVTASVRFMLSSVSHAAINKDLSLRLLDVLSTHFKKSAAARNPSFDAN